MIDPMGKPRMTQRDKWFKRPVVQRYWEYKAEILRHGVQLPEIYKVIFHMPMPKSWSKKKKEQFNTRPHKQTPDKDNLEKGLLDALFEDDSFIWSGWVEKRWSHDGYIEIIDLFKSGMIE